LPEEVLVVGDSLSSDVELAKKNNSNAIYINDKQENNSFGYQNGYFCCSSLQELGKLLT
jgi:FMN phosphatase YigB (HAD superfamily)